MIKVNLLREHALEVPRAAIAPRVNRSGILLLVVFVLVAAGLAWSWWQLDQQRQARIAERDQQQAEIARLQQVRKAADAYEKQKQDLQKRINVIEQLRNNQVGPVELLNTVIACIPAQPVLWLEEMSQDGDSVKVQGYSLTVESISDFIAAMNRSNYFRTVDLEYFTEEQRAVKFSLQCVVARRRSGA